MTDEFVAWWRGACDGSGLHRSTTFDVASAAWQAASQDRDQLRTWLGWLAVKLGAYLDRDRTPMPEADVDRMLEIVAYLKRWKGLDTPGRTT